MDRFSLVVAISVCPIARNRRLRPNSFDWTLLVNEHIANIGIPLDVFAVLQFYDFLRFEIVRVYGSLQTSLLCVGELSGGGSVAVVVGVSDRGQVVFSEVAY